MATTNYTFPGVYLNEVAVAAHTITPATTNLTAFVGAFPRGPVDQAVPVSSWGDFMNQFAGFDSDAPFGANPSLAVYGVWQFFQNGGIGAWIVRLDDTDATYGSKSAQATTTIVLPNAKPRAETLTLALTAADPGGWANGLQVALTASPTSNDHADLVLSYPAPSSGKPTGVGTPLTDLDASNAPAFATAVGTQTYFAATGTGTAPITPTQASFTGGDPNTEASVTFQGVTLTATSKGAWANALTVTLQPSADNAAKLDLILTTPPYQPVETVPNLPAGDPAAAAAIVNEASTLVTATGSNAGTAPALPALLVGGRDVDWADNTGAFATAITNEASTGSARLDKIAPAHFNIMCIPDLAWLATATQDSVFTAAHQFCRDRQAFLVLDPPPPEDAVATAWLPNPAATSIDNIGTNLGARNALLNTWGGDFLGANNIAAATYYPWLQISDPWNNGLPRWVPPSGTVAGVYAATDETRGVWKAPAGTAATLVGAQALADTTINDEIDGDLNVVGINCLRTFPLFGYVSWGTRTLAGADLLDSPFKYVPVRRLTDFIEQSLQQSLKWAVFEPNGPALWSSISAEVTQFMAGLFGSGAFMGTTAAQAYSVACDATTTSAADMLAGIVNVNVAFAAVQPAEFVVLNVTLNAGPPAAAS